MFRFRGRPRSLLTKGRNQLWQRVQAILKKYGSDAHLYTFGPGVPILGPELVVNGGLDSDTAWGKDQATISGGVATITNVSAGVGVLQQGGLALVAGRTYQCTFTVNSITTSGGGLSLRIGSTDSAVVSTPGTYSFPVVYDGTSAVLMARTRFAAVTAQFDNLSLKEITGYSNTYNGFVAGNYIDSAGSIQAAVDQPVGFDLDAAGSVGAEATVGGDFSSAAQWSVIAGFTVASGSLSINAGGGAITNNAGSPAVIGKTYKIDFDVTQFTSGQIKAFMGGQGGVAASAVGHYSSYVVATTTDKPQIYVTSGGTVCQVDNLVVREVTGIHASQSTPGYKPTLRRGIVNLLTYSNDLTNANWAAQGTGVKTAPVFSLPAMGDRGFNSTAGTPSGNCTLALVLSGSGTCDIWGYNATNGNIGITQFTLTATPTLYVVPISPTVAGTQMFFGRNATQGNATATSVTVGAGGYFQGTLTAQQILAAGGIPLTTTAHASSSAGQNYLEFDGVDDRLALGGPLFQMSDDFVVVAGAAMGSGSASRVIFGQAAGGVSESLPELSFDSNGKLGVWVWGGGTNVGLYPGVAETVGSPLVATARKVGTTINLRRNGVITGSASTGGTYTTATNATIGALARNPVQAFVKGSIYPVIAIKGTVSDADLIVLEKYIASLSGVTL